MLIRADYNHPKSKYQAAKRKAAARRNDHQVARLE